LRNSQGGELAGEHGLVPGGGHKGLGGEIVDFLRASGLQRCNERALVQQIGLEKTDLLHEVGDAITVVYTTAAHNAKHFIALSKEKFRQVGTVLACDAGNDRALAHTDGFSAPADCAWKNG